MFLCSIHNLATGRRYEIKVATPAEVEAILDAKACYGTAGGRTVVVTDLATVERAEARAAAVRAVQAHLDATARAWGYDDIFTAVTYADEPEAPQFQAEGRALRKWRSKVWRACYASTATTIDGLLADLPPVPVKP